MQARKYIDMHTHTTNSDGMWGPEHVVEEALRNKVGFLALSDHNRTTDLSYLRKKHPDIALIDAAEFSCMYTHDDITQEVHVIGLGFDPNNSKIHDVIEKNQPDRRPYIQAILDRLSQIDIHIGTYDSLRNELSTCCTHFGRTQLAIKMHQLGYVNSVAEAFDEYIGEYGKRKAYVKCDLVYVSLQQCVEAIVSAGGVAVLCHLLNYRLGTEGERWLLQYFKSFAGSRGALETSYGMYSEEERQYLRTLADEFGLLHSAGSDFHAKEGDSLNHQFDSAQFQPILEALGYAPQIQSQGGECKENLESNAIITNQIKN